MITGWGANTRYVHVHYFRDDGRPACATRNRLKSTATIRLPDWNPDHPNTCEKCRKVYRKLAAVTK